MSKPITILPIESNNFDLTLEFLREHFFPNEPCAKAINLCPLGYRIPALENQILSILQKNLSFGAFVEGSNELAGVVIVEVKKSGESGPPVSPECPCNDFPDKFQKLDRFFTDLTTGFGKRDSLKALGIEDALDIFIIATRAGFQGQGVATALSEQVLKTAQDKGIGGVTCMALSAYTQRICQRLSFQEFFRIPYSDYEQEGEHLFANADSDIHNSGVYFAKKV